jgi:hypothetical protein
VLIKLPELKVTEVDEETLRLAEKAAKSAKERENEDPEAWAQRLADDVAHLND